MIDGLPSVARLRAALAPELERARHGDWAALDGIAWHIDRHALLWASPDQRRQLAGLGLAGVDQLPAPGVVLGAAVTPDMDQARLVRVAVQVPSTAADGLSGVRPVARDALFQGASLALALFPFPLPYDPSESFCWSVTDLAGRPLGDEAERQVDGRSLGLCGLVAAWSALAGLPVVAPGGRPVVLTGALASWREAHDTPVFPVDGVLAKARETASLGAELVLPRGELEHLGLEQSGTWQGVSVTGVGKVTDLLAHVFGPTWDRPGPGLRHQGFDPAYALVELDLSFQRRGHVVGWARLAARFEALADHLDTGPHAQDLRALALARAGACHDHARHPARAQERLAQALALVEGGGPDRIDGVTEARARTHRAMALRDLYRLEEATVEATRAWECARSNRAHRTAAHARAALGLVLAGAGQAELALPHVRHARDFHDDCGSATCGRAHADVIYVLGRLGRWQEAAEEAALARPHIDRRCDPAQARQHHTYLASAELSARLRGFRRIGARADQWRALHDQAATAAEIADGRWPRDILERIALAAAARLPGVDLAPRLASRRERLHDPQLTAQQRWQAGLALFEVALARAQAGRWEPEGQALCAEGLAGLPEEGRGFFAGQVAALEGGAPEEEAVVGVLGVLEREVLGG